MKSSFLIFIGLILAGTLAWADQSPRSCKSIKPSSNQVGTKCITSKGSLFERVYRQNFGEAWKGPDGLIWSDRLGNNDQYRALDICWNRGGYLPEQGDFESGEANEFREVLPNMKEDSLDIHHR